MEFYYIGQGVTVHRKITEKDILQFAELTGDKNPIHVDLEYASRSCYKKQIAHGMLVASFVSYVLGMVFPGPGTIYMEQDIHFLYPVFVDDALSIHCYISEIIKEEKRIAKIDTEIKNQNGKVVAQGYSVVKLPEDKEMTQI